MFNDVTNADELIAAFQNFKATKNGKARRSPTGQFQMRRQNPQSGDRPPRKCPNCGEAHEARTCPKPSVAVSDRKCWTCGEKHMAKDCPKKGQRSIKAIGDGPLAAVTNAITAGALNGFFIVDEEGFETVRNSKGRPRTFQPPGGVAGAMGVLPVEPAGETPGCSQSKSGNRSPLHGGHGANGTSRNLKMTSRPMPTERTLGSFLTTNNFDVLSDTTDTTRLADSSPVSGRAALAATAAKAPAPATTTSPGNDTTRPRHDTTRPTSSSGKTTRCSIASLQNRSVRP